MKNLIKLTTLVFFVLNISACGRMGDLTPVKSSSLTMSNVIYHG